jgi:non-specific serine/threonine protein kinase/serine/threonine-protein kinase
LLALALDTPLENRRAALEELESDPALVDLAMEVLEGDDPRFLSGPAVRNLSGLAELARDDAAPALPGYTILGLLGRGGMGEVFLASDDASPDHRVAIKRIRSAFDDGALGRRFALERDALSRLQHPAVARFFGSGTAPDGSPYVVMEYVDGRPITLYCDEERLAIEERLRLFVAVCRGVEHAHRRQLLHRDLKPSNILVASVDGEASPKVIDFGIARVLDAPIGAAPTLTETAVGTAAYMSPEALSVGDGPRDLDTRTDVYSLGIVLYELLVGHRPWDGRNDDPLLPSRILREDPPVPSTRWRGLDAETLTTAAENRRSDQKEVASQLAGDLDWIVTKAIDRDRARRYSSVGELAADIERHLRLEPVEARPPTFRYRADRFVRRHRLPVAAALVAASALLVGSAAAIVGMLRAREAAQQATEAKDEAEAVASFMERVFRASSPLRRENDRAPWEVTARELLDQGAERVEKDLSAQPVASARVRSSLGGVYVGLGLYEEGQRQLVRALDDFDRADASTSPEQRVVVEWKLGQALFYLARYDEALDHLDRSAALARERLAEPRRTRELARTHTIRGRVYRRQARFDLAEGSLREAIAMLRAANEYDAELKVAMNNLAAVFFTQERWAEAETQSRKSLRLARRLYPPGHLMITSDLGSLGSAIAAQGRYEEAAALLTEAYEMKRVLLADDHPALAGARDDLGDLAAKRGNYEEAVSYHRAALESRLRALGDDLPQTATSHHGLGVALAGLGRTREAEAELERALAIRRNTLGAGHPAIAASLVALGDLARAASDWTRAEALYREALEVRRAGHRDTDPRVADAALDLAEVLLELGKAAEIEPLLAEADRHRSGSGQEAEDLQRRVDAVRTRDTAIHAAGS